MAKTWADAGGLTYIRPDPETLFFFFFLTISFHLSHRFPSWENDSFGRQEQGPRAHGKVKRSPCCPADSSVPSFSCPWGGFSARSPVSPCEACNPIQDVEPLTPVPASMGQFTPAEVLAPAGMGRQGGGVAFGEAGYGCYRAPCWKERIISKPSFSRRSPCFIILLRAC